MTDKLIRIVTLCEHQGTWTAHGELDGETTHALGGLRWCPGGTVVDLTRQEAIPIIAKAIWANDEDWAENGPYQLPTEDAMRVWDALLAGDTE